MDAAAEDGGASAEVAQKAEAEAEEDAMPVDNQQGDGEETEEYCVVKERGLR